MGMMKKIYSGYFVGEDILIPFENINAVNKFPTLKSYAKTNCLFLIADIKKIEKEYNFNLDNILKETLIYCFDKEIKKPRAKYINNSIKLYSEKYNYVIYLKSYSCLKKYQ